MIIVGNTHLEEEKKEEEEFEITSMHASKPLKVTDKVFYPTQSQKQTEVGG